MPIYWFFDLAAVAERNLFLADIRGADTFMEAAFAMLESRRRRSIRPATRVPL
jgi:hypothetical protein